MCPDKLLCPPVVEGFLHPWFRLNVIYIVLVCSYTCNYAMHSEEDIKLCISAY